MKLTGIRVEGVGKFTNPVMVSGLGPGINILAAGNEAGKSTLFRAIRTCLFERHGTSRGDVNALASNGATLPVKIIVEFEHNGHDYRIEKSFLRSRSAQFFRNGALIARDRAADEAVWELIGITPGNGRKDIDEAAFGLLWVGQRQSFSPPHPSEAAAAVLNRAIHDEVGTLVGGERVKLLLSSLITDIDRFYTAHGRPKAGGPLAAALQQRDALTTELAEVQQRLTDLDTHLTELAARLGERTLLNDPALNAELANDLAAARKACADGEAAQMLFSRFEMAKQQAGLSLDAAERALNDHLQRAARIDANRERLDGIKETLELLDTQIQDAKADISAAETAKMALDERLHHEESRERALQCLVASRARAAELEDLKHRRAELVALKNKITTNEIALESNGATKQAMAELDRVQKDIAIDEARFVAAATQVSLEIGPAGAGRVMLDGRAVDADIVQAAVKPVSIAIDDIATIVITPPSTEDMAAAKRREKHETALESLLKNSGYENPQALRLARTARETLEENTLLLNAELKFFGIEADALTAKIANLDREIAQIESLKSSTQEEDGIDACLSDTAITTKLAALQASRDDIRKQRQALDTRLSEFNSMLAKLAARRGETAGSLAEIQTSLKSDLLLLPDDNRTAQLANFNAARSEARETFQTRAAALEGQRQKTPSVDEIERLQLRIKRLEEATNNQTAKLEQVERIIANLEGQIQNAGGDGLGERAEILRANLNLAVQEVSRIEKHAATLQLLRDTVESCYQKHRERLTAPLRRHLTPYLNDVFPSAEVTLGDGFSIEAIRRNSPDAELFESLSDGTQEQIAVLVRLAMGSLLAERGYEVPIILDDALVYSDDGRITQMFDALSRAGEKQQVIILTCRTRAFASLGGRPLTITDTDA